MSDKTFLLCVSTIKFYKLLNGIILLLMNNLIEIFKKRFVLS